MVNGHKTEGRVNIPVDNLKVQSIRFSNRVPVGDPRAAQGINANPDAGCSNRTNVDHIDKIIDIRLDKIHQMGGVCL